MRAYDCFLIFIIVTFYSCGKPKNTYQYIENDEVKSALSFKNGSYFIFVDSVNNNIDSGVVEGQYSVIKNVEGQPSNYYLQGMGYDLNFYPGHISFYSTGSPETQSIVYMNYNKDSIELVPIAVLVLPFIQDQYIHNSILENCHSIYHFDSLKVRNNIYENVYKYSNELSGYKFDTYYSPEFGLIKYSIGFGVISHIWELDRFNILPK